MPEYDMPSPDRFTAGTVGEPGHRTFFLQAASDHLTVTLKCEKQQVGALAEHLAGLIADLPVPSEDEVTAADVAFVEPEDASWAVGRMGVAWDESTRGMILVCEQLLDEEAADTGAEPESARFRLSLVQVVAFVELARDLVAAGRPPCYLCGLPMEPTGHPCPRLN
jgi:uncharacterized repeat protein (TIGR03847 family)